MSAGLGASVRLLSDADARAELAADRDLSVLCRAQQLPQVERDIKRVEANGTPTITGLDAQDGQGEALRYVLRFALLRDAGVTAHEAERILDGIAITPVTVEGDEVSGLGIAASTIAVPMVFVGLFMISTVFITSGYLLQSVTEEKENRVVEIVLSSIPPLPLMSGKIGPGWCGFDAGRYLVATALVALPLLSSQVGDLSGIAIDPVILVLALLYFVLGYLAYGAIFAAIGAIAPGNREAQQYSGFLGFAVPFILFAVFLSDLSSTVAYRPVAVPTDRPDLDAPGHRARRRDPVDAGRSLIGQPDPVRAAGRLGVVTDLPRHGAALRGSPQPAGPDSRRSAHHARTDPRRAATAAWTGSLERLPLVDGRASARLVLEPAGVQLDVLGVLRRHRILGEDGRDRALRFAGATVDALVRIDEVHAVGALVVVDAVHWGRPTHRPDREHRCTARR